MTLIAKGRPGTRRVSSPSSSSRLSSLWGNPRLFKEHEPKVESKPGGYSDVLRGLRYQVHAPTPFHSTITIMDDALATAESAHPKADCDSDSNAGNPTTSASLAPDATTTTSATATGNSDSGSLPLRHGHEQLPFVAPSSYLRPKPVSRTMSDHKALGPLDKDQMQGLVSSSVFLFSRFQPTFAACISSIDTFLHHSVVPRSAESIARLWFDSCECGVRNRRQKICTGRDSGFLIYKRLTFLLLHEHIERDSRIPQGPDQLRCIAAIFPSRRPR